MPEIHNGLEDIYIDRSNISRVFGDEGTLTYRGYWIEDLAQHATYEEVVYLLINGDLPDEDELDAFTDRLANHRMLNDTATDVIDDMAGDTAPMDVLRTAVSACSEGVHVAEFDVAENRERGLQIIAKMPTIIARIARIRDGEDPIAPRDDLSHAANFYYMLHGDEPTAVEADAVNTALILYAEHGMNASTLAAVTTASTLADMYSAITSGIGALQGPLHGGATETVVDMLDDIGSTDNVADWVDKQLDAGAVIPGFGHRVYKAVDPRCAQFADVYTDLAEAAGEQDRLALIERVREYVVDEKGLGANGIYPNGDLYSGTVYNALGIDADLYTCMFTMARVAGWTAHVLEQWEDNRILRPRIEYTGELDREWVSLEQR
jgi:citrate synthase